MHYRPPTAPKALLIATSTAAPTAASMHTECMPSSCCCCLWTPQRLLHQMHVFTAEQLDVACLPCQTPYSSVWLRCCLTAVRVWRPLGWVKAPRCHPQPGRPEEHEKRQARRTRTFMCAYVHVRRVSGVTADAQARIRGRQQSTGPALQRGREPLPSITALVADNEKSMGDTGLSGRQ